VAVFAGRKMKEFFTVMVEEMPSIVYQSTPNQILDFSFTVEWLKILYVFLLPECISRSPVNQGKKPVDFIFMPGGLMALYFYKFTVTHIDHPKKFNVQI
jgi:hypothetical protein